MQRIPIADDVLRKFIEWIPRKNLRNVSLAKRRFWWFCDESLEERKYTIYRMHVTKNNLLVTKKRIIDGRLVYDKVTVPFAEVQPPENFKLEHLRVDKEGIDEQALNFLRVSKPLFLRANLHVDWDYVNILDKFLDVFDNCFRIKIWWADSTLAEEFFAKGAISNCKSLSVCAPYNNPFDPNSAFNWLHSSSSASIITKRQIDFRTFFNSTQFIANFYALVSRLKKKFLEDDVKRKFVVRFYRHTFSEHIREENLQTGEVMFLRGNNEDNYRDLVRSAKREEETVAYEKINIDDYYEHFDRHNCNISLSEGR